MTKDKIIALAKKKGFESNFLYAYPYVYTLREDMRYYLWLCEISRWLIDEHDVLVEHYSSLHNEDLFTRETINKLEQLQDIKNDKS